jgi:chaperonin cofactor prefoldin
VDKYTTICNILQAGVAAMETIENLKLEDTPKDVSALVKILSHKLTTTELKQDTETIENQIEHLNQKIDHLTKTLTNTNQIQNAATHQHRKHLPHSTHNTPRKQQNPQNPLAQHHHSRLTIIFKSPPPISDHNESARILTNVNNSLTLAKLDVRIAGVTWSLAGNCILLTREGHSATDLKPHALSISQFLTKNPSIIKDISEEKP